MHHIPNALLLDFGGVIADTAPRKNWATMVAKHVHTLLPTLSFDQLVRDISRGSRRDAEWKNRASQDPTPKELDPHTFWVEFVASDWPKELRAELVPHAQSLCDAMVQFSEDRTLRAGIRDVFQAAQTREIPIAIVSNTLSGRVYRHLVEAWELDVHASIYSVEAGIRKPNPALITHACDTLDVRPQDAWFVGDTYDRDVVCGTRAQIGKNILLRSIRTASDPPESAPLPDLTLSSAYELARLITSR
ncbi:MAG: HAD family hydrolase [Canibacter sp.]